MKKGVTLIELVVIIGFLSVIVGMIAVPILLAKELGITYKEFFALKFLFGR